MFNLSVINPYNSTSIIEVLGDVDYLSTKSISSFIISNRKLGDIMNAKIVFNADFPFFNDILNNLVQFGIKYQTDYVNLAFIAQDARIKTHGEVEVDLVSSAWKMNKMFSYRFKSYQGSLSTFLNYLGKGEIVFTPIGNDEDIKINTGNFSDYELMNEAIKYPDKFNWRENGLITSGGATKTQILYGDFSKIDEYYATSSDPACLGLSTTTQSVDVQENLDTIQIDKITKHFGFNYVNRLYVFAGTGGQEASLNSIIPLTPSNVDVNRQFPLILGDDNFYYIQNPLVPQAPILEGSRIYSDTANSEDNTGTQNFNPQALARWAYQQGINYLRNSSLNSYYSIAETNIKRFILAGNSLKLDYKDSYFDLAETRILDNLSEFNPFEINY